MERIKDWIEARVCRWLIGRLEWGYGKCPELEDGCASCDAGRTIRFLRDHIRLIEME